MSALRLRKSLAGKLLIPAWPLGIRLAPLASVAPQALHALIVEGYANGYGQIAGFDTWWTNLITDGEFDPSLVLVAVEVERPVAIAQSWTSAFLKDLVVAESHRGKGLGEALLWQTFALFKARGSAHVDLKVDAENAVAQRLYARVGMMEVAI